MSNVSDIISALETQIGTLLGSNWQQLDYVYDLEKNNLRGSKKAYGVGVGSGNSVSGTNKAVTVDQQIFVVVTDTYGNRSSGANDRAVISTLFDQLETINNDIFQKKLGLSNIVLLVQELGNDDPEFLNDNTVAIRANYIIKHRKNNF